MANETAITIVGNLVDDPELRFTAAGIAVGNFTVASTERVYDKTAGQWKDGPALFLRCTVWRQMAENVGDSLTKGTRVVVSGVLRQRSFETKDGQKRSVIEMEAEEVGPSLRFATAKVVKPGRSEAAAVDGWTAPAQSAPNSSPWDVPAMAGAGAPNPPF